MEFFYLGKEGKSKASKILCSFYRRMKSLHIVVLLKEEIETLLSIHNQVKICHSLKKYHENHDMFLRLSAAASKSF
jgi:hypothetical protein